MMNNGAHFAVHRESRWHFRMALICAVFGSAILAGWYIGDGNDWLYSSGKVRYIVVPLGHLMLFFAPLLWWTARTNDLPVLMLTDTALLYRATIWTSEFRGIRRERITSTSIHDQTYNGRIIARLIQIHVDDIKKAMLVEPNSIAARLNRAMFGPIIVIPTAGWPLTPEEVKSRIDAWVKEDRN
jgi:hypothetical protein